MRTVAHASLIALGAACGGTDPRVEVLRLTAPVGTAEVVPIAGQALPIAWELEAHGDVDVVVTLVPDRSGVAPVELGRFTDQRTATWTVPVTPPRHGTYRVRADAVAGEAPPLATAWAPAVVVLQGAHFRAQRLSFTATDPERDVWIEATVARQIGVALIASAGGTDRVLARTTIASDLAPIGRVFAWSGADVDGVALAAATYAVALDVTTADDLHYRIDGLTVEWRP